MNIKTLVFVSILIIYCSAKDKESFQCSNACDSGAGQPLYLTQLMKSGKLSDAKSASKVCGLPFADNITSYSGYLTVNSTFNSNLFFWFFPALNGNTSAPVILWLNGGPGTSSLFGLFVENGPYVVDSNNEVLNRVYTWTQQFSVLYIDAPVGAGFSFTDDDRGYATNIDDVSRDLYSALQQFFTIFSEYRKNDFYLSGECYAAKYILATANKIHNMAMLSNINMKGIAIGNGWIDPATMYYHGDLLYSLGLFDETQRDIFNNLQDQVLSAILYEQYFDGFLMLAPLFQPIGGQTSLFTKYTGSHNHNNFLLNRDPSDFYYYQNLITQNSVRCAIHAGNGTYDHGFDGQPTVIKHLATDLLQSTKDWLRILLDANYKVLLFNGNLDVLVAPVFIEKLLWRLDWSKNQLYRTTEPVIWKVAKNDTDVAGYVRKADNLVQINVRNCGRIVAHDQPRVAKDMIERFILNKPF